MAADPDCLFCKIVAGEVPATRVAEDDRTGDRDEIAEAAKALEGG